MKPAATENRPRFPHSTPDRGIRLPTQVAWLSNGSYSTRLSGVGSGWSECRGLAITRWLNDRTREADGFFIYLRDVESNAVWSAGYQPTLVEADRYDFSIGPSAVEIVRSDDLLECRMKVCVASDYDLEVRRCELINRGSRPRRIELTSYLEWVLCPQAADANHPAFSKLFVETQLFPEHGAILARRRPRSGDEAEAWGFHTLACDDDNAGLSLRFETERAAFIGRGRSVAMPRAFDPGIELSARFGAVLDPIASLQTTIHLAPGERRELAFVLGTEKNRADVEVALSAVARFSQIEQLCSQSAASVPWTNGELSFSNGNGSDHLSHVVPQFFPSNSPLASGKKPSAVAHATNEPELLFENGYGGFSTDGTEYILRIQPDEHGRPQLPPRPWVNVIANEQAGFLVTERGAGYSWAGNSRENRLTAWHNDPVSDPHAEACWIRDDDERVFWSPTPGPTPAAAEYLVRHGFGYSTFEHDSHELSQRVTMFVPRDEPVKITWIRLVNRSHRPRRLSLFSHSHWALGSLTTAAAGTTETNFDSELGAILATNPERLEYGADVAFSALLWTNGPECDVAHSCDRKSFLGYCRDLQSPAAVADSSQLDGQTDDIEDHCAAWQASFLLPPHGTAECAVLLGETRGRDSAASLINKYRTSADVERAFDEVRTSWKQLTSAISIETPDREIDLMVNGWLVYQNVSCRLWARSAYYQPGGAFGFRDQLQDAAALILQRPDITRGQILLHAAQQFVEGDILHWWHPDNGYGLRTRFSDDLLWLPYFAAYYVRSTGDEQLWDEVVPFITGRALAGDEQESYQRPELSGTEGTIYEHCCRALDRGLTVGEHGLPLIGCGDWNDGMNRIGRQGRGESVWLGFFVHHILDQMLPFCQRRGDQARFDRYRQYRERLNAALNAAGWDGDWYRRAYYDNGQPLGSTSSDECQIDALAQAWAIISGAAPSDRAARAMRAVEERLIDDDAGLIRLLTPPFDKTPHDPGYIKGYLPGIRENGGQYTHGVLWVVRAMAELGRGTRAVELLRMLSPVWHTRSPEQVAVYQTEPYVVAADVYGEPPHVGRGGWTWYTGSAGWMFRVAVESIFGLSIEGGKFLVLNPTISAAWPQCRISYQLPGSSTQYHITVENPSRKERGVSSVTVDGEPVPVENGVARVPLKHDDGVHRVVAWL